MANTGKGHDTLDANGARICLLTHKVVHYDNRFCSRSTLSEEYLPKQIYFNGNVKALTL